MKPKTLCFYCIRKLWQFFAISLVLLACLVSLLKFGLPYANDYRSDIEQLLSEQLAVNLSIGSLDASWKGNGPALVVRDIEFTDNQNAPVSVLINEARIHVNLWKSLVNWQLYSHYFVLNGFNAKLNLDTLFNDETPSQGSQQQDFIEHLFLGQSGYFEIENSHLYVTVNNKSHHVLLDQLVWENRGNDHLAEGEISLPNLKDNALAAQLHITGQSLAQVQGDLFVKAQNMELSSWLGGYLSPALDKPTTDINFESWLHFKQGRINDVQLVFAPSELNWQQNAQPKQFGITQGMLRFYPEKGQWRIATSGIEFTQQGNKNAPSSWSPLVFAAMFDRQFSTAKVWLQQLDLTMASQFAKLIDAPQLSTALAVNPTGKLDAYFHWQNAQQWQGWLKGTDLSWQPHQEIIGAQGVNLVGRINQQRGRFSISSEQNQLLTGEMFSKPLRYERISSDIDLYHTESGWWLQSDNSHVKTPHLALNLEFGLLLSAQPELSLYGELSKVDAEFAAQYFPRTYMHKRLIDYLTAAIKQGELQQAQVLMQGKLADFPYGQKQGRFEVLAQVNNAEFEFAPDWAAVKQGNVALHFSNQRMDIYTQQGKLLNLELNDSVHVYINNIMQSDNLFVDINTQVEASLLHPFFADTPLADPLANITDIIQAKGQLKGKVQLNVDLNTLDVLAKGEVKFNNNSVYLSQPGVPLTRLKGELRFVDDQITLSKGRAKWLGMPLTFSVKGDGDKTSYHSDIALQLQLDLQKLMAHSGGLLPEQFSGITPISSQLQLNFAQKGFNYQASVTSDFHGAISQLPAPYGKTAAQKWALTGQVKGDDISNLITLNLNDQLYFNSIIDNSSGKMSSAHLIMSKENLGLNPKGFDVSINLPQVELLDWLPVLDNIITLASQPSEQPSILPPFNQVTGKIASLTVADIPFNEFSFTLKEQAKQLNLYLKAAELQAKAVIPAQQSQQPITINADYLHLVLPKSDAHAPPSDTSLTTVQNPVNDEPVSPVQENSEHQWLTRLPAIDFYCTSCKINSYQLDKVTIQLQGTGQALNISQLNVDKGMHNLTATGIWQAGQTQFKGKFNSDDIGKLFAEFDLTTTVQDSDAQIDFALNWQDVPYQFDIATLAGEVNWQLGEGHLSEVSDGGARVFSLLSLDSLVRKLKLDFRDVFSKGFFYNEMHGSMQLANGIAYTKDTKMNGVPADLTIQGYADLNNQEINYDLAVSPEVTSSLPVIVAWMVNPVTGLAALALDKVIHSAKVISQINFKVTGTIAEPNVVEVNRKSKEVTLPVAQNQPEPTAVEPASNNENPQEQQP